MDIEFFGANCFRIKTKGTVIVVDDNLKALGGKSPQSDKSVAFFTNPLLEGEQKHVSRLTINTPGEFEVGDVTVTGVQARGHMDEEGVESATVFQFMMMNQTVTILGHIHPDVSSEVIELVGGSDVLIIPVGGNGYTLDPTGAAGVIKKIEPGIVIPSHYDNKDLNFEVPQQSLEEFLKLMPASEGSPQDVFKLAKSESDSAAQTNVIVLKSN